MESGKPVLVGADATPAAARAAAAAPPPGPGSVLSRLTRLSAGPHRVISCYLPLAPEARLRRQYLKSFRERLRAAARRPDETLSREARRMLEDDFARVEQCLRPPARLPDAGGLALFACGARGLFEVVPVPRVHRPRIVVDRSAFVRELVELNAEFGQVYAAVVDRAHARFFAIGAFEATELPGLPGVATRGGRFHRDRQDSPGWGERHYHNRITRERERHYEAVARRLRQLDRSRPARGIVLAAPASGAARLERFLDADLAHRLLGHGRLAPRSASAQQVFEVTARLRREHERASGRAELARMRELVGEGWAVNGVEPTLAALFRGQVRTLLVAGQLERPGYRCGTGRLVTNIRECRGERPAFAVPDVIDDAIEEALRQRARVLVIEEPEAAGVQGLAAVLRFR